MLWMKLLLLCYAVWCHFCCDTLSRSHRCYLSTKRLEAHHQQFTWGNKFISFSKLSHNAMVKIIQPDNHCILSFGFLWLKAIISAPQGNSIVYRNSKLWKIIIWLLCIINCFCLWYGIIWWYCIIFMWKNLWLSIIWFYDEFRSYYDFPSYDDYAS